MARTGQEYLDYERAPGHLADGDPIGQREMVDLTRRSLPAVYKWHERKVLPPADGPIVNGLPTWRRRTFYAWAYERGFTRDAEGNHLPMHKEAYDWHKRVPAETTTPLRDIERQQRRARAS